MDELQNCHGAEAATVVRLSQLVLSTSELRVQPDFCFDGIASRDLASTAAGRTVVRVAERSSQVVELYVSRD